MSPDSLRAALASNVVSMRRSFESGLMGHSLVVDAIKTHVALTLGSLGIKVMDAVS